MPSFCCVVNCGSVATRDNVSFYKIPSIYNQRKQVCPLRAKRRQLWLQAIKRDDLTETKIKYAKVCSKHFVSGKTADLQDEDDPDWVPSVNMGYNLKPRNESARDKRTATRASNKQFMLSEDVVASEVEKNITEATGFNESTPQDQIEELKRELDNLRVDHMKISDEVYKLRQKVQSFKYDEASFENDPEKCRYYTGLSVPVLKFVYSVVEPYLIKNSNCTLSKFEALILTLMKLSKNYEFMELGYKFNIHRVTASRYFYKTLYVLSQRLKNFIYWPSREELKSCMPQEFKKSFDGKVTVIIDCFELFIQKPSQVQSLSQTFSHYKHHNTLKFMIGITAHGVICFISEAYGGRCSDNFVTTESGFLEKLLPGDIVLADRGFTIGDSAEIYCATVITPTFLKGKNQLAPKDIEKTRQVACLRIHVERNII